jgi:hypothetical protein
MDDRKVENKLLHILPFFFIFQSFYAGSGPMVSGFSVMIVFSRL